MKSAALYSLEGQWTVRLSDNSRWEATLPGSLDENRIGYRDAGTNQWHPDDGLGSDVLFDPNAPIATRLTRRYTYEGPAWFTRVVDFEPEPGKRVFLEVERARCLMLLVNGREVPNYVEPSISTPHVFEVTGLMHRGAEITLVSDNSYPGLPHDAIVYSSAAPQLKDAVVVPGADRAHLGHILCQFFIAHLEVACAQSLKVVQQQVSQSDGSPGSLPCILDNGRL